MLDQAQTEVPAAGTAAGADGLVEAAGVRGRIYTDPAIFEEELRRIWGGTWIYVGHESQVPEPGDWYATRIGRVPGR